MLNAHVFVFVGWLSLVQFHAHSDGYNTLIACPNGYICKKLWFLTPPKKNPSPEFPIYRDWCCGPSSWIHDVLPDLLEKQSVGWTDNENQRPFFVVVQRVGETIYIPENWNHATLSLGQFTVSVAGQLRIGHTSIGRMLWKADYLKSKNQHKHALSLYERALEMDANNRETKMKLGIQWATLAFQKDRSQRAKFLGKAREIYEKATEENHQDINAIASLAEVEYLDGNANKSYELYDRALALMPTNIGKAMYLVGKARSATNIDGGKVSRGLFILKGALYAAHTNKEAADLILPDMIALLKETHKTWTERLKRNPNEKRGKLVMDRLEQELKTAERQRVYAQKMWKEVMGKGDERDFLSDGSQHEEDEDKNEDKDEDKDDIVQKLIVPAKTNFHLNARTMRTKLCVSDRHGCKPSPSCGLIIIPNNTTLSRALHKAVLSEKATTIISVSSPISSRTKFTKRLLSDAPADRPAYIVAARTGIIHSLLPAAITSISNRVDNVMDHIFLSVNRICGTQLFTEHGRLSSNLHAILLNDKAWSPKSRSTAFSLQSRGARVDFKLLKHVIEHGQPATLARCFEFTSDAVKHSTNHRQQTLLHIAVLGANVNQEVIQIVFSACGPSCLHAKEVNGETPLAASIRNWIHWFWEARETKPNPYTAAAALLLRLGADPDTRDRMGTTPLMKASRSQNYEGVHLLLQHGANPALVDRMGSSSLHHSVEWLKFTVEISKKFVSKSIDLVAVAEFSNAMDEIHDECTTKLQRAANLIGAKYLGIQDGIQADEIACALVDCSFFDRTTSLLIKALEKAGKDNVLETTNGIRRTVLEMAHPRMRSRLRKMTKSATLSSLETSVLGDGLGLEKMHRLDGNADNLNSERCDFDVRSASTLSAAEFQNKFFQQSRPVLVLNATDYSWRKFRSTLANETWLLNLQHVHKQNQRQRRFKVEVGSIPYAKNFNVADSKSLSISEYLEHILVPAPTPPVMDKQRKKSKKKDKKKESPSRHPLYLFHAVDMTNVKSLKRASPLEQNIVGHLGNFSSILTSLDLFETAQWYFGSHNSGAPMHFHGSALNVLLRGRKLWAMLPPRAATYSRQHPSTFMSTFEASRVSRVSGKHEKSGSTMWCEQPSGSFLFVPAGWSHAVLNLDKVVAGVAVEIIHVGTEQASRQWRKLSEDGLDVQGLGVDYIADR